MAYGNVVGFILDITQLDGYDPGPEIEQYDLVEAIAQVYEEDLHQAHVDTCSEYFGVEAKKCIAGYQNTPKQYHWAATQVVTDELNLALTPFSIIEHDDEETQVVMLPLSARYRPTYLDYKDPHGTLYPAITFDDEMNNMIAVARNHLSQVIPQIAELPISVFMAWY